LQIVDRGDILERGEVALAGTSAELTGKRRVVESCPGCTGAA
jgi:hypothetical protein